MKNLKLTAVILFAITLTVGCAEIVDDGIEDAKEELKEDLTEEIEELDLSPENVAEGRQTDEERIAEIKALYAKIQQSPKQNKDCVSNSKTTINYDIIDEGFPMTNTAKSCQLEDGLRYMQVELNGYEWAETANFYFKDDQLFFAYTSGGAEAYGYEYRVYYDKDGEVIRVLLSENDYDGEEVGSPFEVKNEGRKKEILDAIERAKKELKELLNDK